MTAAQQKRTTDSVQRAEQKNRKRKMTMENRPIIKKEQVEIEQKVALKNKKRDEEYAHYDIRPYNDLRNGSEKYDIALTRHLLLIAKPDEKL